jgi:group II intron reverse transcriptase/maturase
VGGNPKLNKRQFSSELGMPRSGKLPGVRRIHSTTLICGKGSSSDLSIYDRFSGRELDLSLGKLQINQNGKYNNLSQILSKPEWLYYSWTKIRSNKGSLTPAFEGTLDGIDQKWFVETANGIRNGMFQFKPARRTCISKPNGKLRPLTIPSPRDKIVQVAVTKLLERIFEPTFEECSHGFRPKRWCHSAINSIKRDCIGINWYIEGGIEQQFPSINHTTLVNELRKRIDDEHFIDLIYKYLRIGYGENINNISPMKVGVVQGGILSPLLSNIYMDVFDKWVLYSLKPKFNLGTKRTTNPEYWKQAYQFRVNKVKKDLTIRSTPANDPNWRRVYYYRYADDFIVGVSGSKDHCIELRNDIQKFLQERLELKLNLDKTIITHAESSSAKFLGFVIHKTKLKKMARKRDSSGHMSRRVPRPVVDAPIYKIVKKLAYRGYAKNDGSPTAYRKLINHPLPNIISHYLTVERGILNYYSIANNYGRLATRVHYILKFSCVLTIALKMRLRTTKKVFRKYCKDLKICIPNEKFISYPTANYKRSTKVFRSAYSSGALDYKDVAGYYSRRAIKANMEIAGPCSLCGSNEDIEIHHVRALPLRKGGLLIKKDFMSRMMSKYNRKQIPLCKPCHIKVHKGEYYGRKLD